MAQLTTQTELRILLLEDSPTDAELIERALRKGGMDFTSRRVETQEAFVRALEDFIPDIVLLDFSLPAFGGLAALNIIRHDYPEIPAIIVTGALSDKEAVDMLKAGAKDYVLKDRLARLLPAVQHALLVKQGNEAKTLADRALRESEQRLRTIIESSMDAVVQINAEGVITGWSRQAEEIFGWASAEAVGRAIHETIIPSRHREAHIQGIKHFQLTGEGPILNKRVEIVGLHRDGSEFPIELTVTVLQMSGKDEFSAFIRDITERKGFEEKLKRSNMELEQFNAAMSSDLQVAQDAMRHIMRSEGLRDPEIRHFQRPTRQFSGDIIAAARDSNCDLRLMLADVTGHGLQAALFLLPIFRVFYSMVNKGFPTCVIVSEINRTVRDIAVTGHFIAAVVAHISRDGSFYEVWNGGIPNAVLVQEGGELHEFHSRHLPFGLSDTGTFEAATEIFHARPGTFLISSDGLTEAENASGEPFGETRLRDLLRTSPPDALFENILGALETHLGGLVAHDDISVVIARCGAY